MVLVQGKGSERNKHIIVEFTGIEDEDVDDLLEVSDSGCGEGCGEVLGGSELDRGSIFDIGTGGRGVLGLG